MNWSLFCTTCNKHMRGKGLKHLVLPCKEWNFGFGIVYICPTKSTLGFPGVLFFNKKGQVSTSVYISLTCITDVRVAAESYVKGTYRPTAVSGL
jgi:hypothetical protein